MQILSRKQMMKNTTNAWQCIECPRGATHGEYCMTHAHQKQKPEDSKTSDNKRIIHLLEILVKNQNPISRESIVPFS